jgi:hypothetical protein
MVSVRRLAMDGDDGCEYRERGMHPAAERLRGEE